MTARTGRVVKRLAGAGLAAGLAASLSLAVQAPLPAAAATTWQDRLNGWRALTNLPALAENTTWDAGDHDHAVYMVKNQLVTHYEDPSKPYYTAAGDQAARNGNIEVSSTTSFQDWQAIDWWMGAPFHAMGLMDPRLTSTGFGEYREAVPSGWQAGFAIDVLRGNSFSGGSYPVYFPGNGSSEPLTSYSGYEFPDPLSACSGYSMPTGLPVFVQVGGNVTTSVTAHVFTGNGTALPHCVIDGNNPTLGSDLHARGGVIVIPRSPLQVGVTYTVALTVNGLPYTWSFNVSSGSAMVPGVPTNVGAIAGDTTATVTWSAPSYTGGTAIASYTVTPHVGSTAGTPQVVTAPTTTALFTGLTNGTTYWFTVAATNTVGTGPTAMSYSVTPTSTAAPPSRMTAPSSSQYRLPNSDGVTWQDIDAANLSLSVTPSVDSVAIISGNADLWTANPGYNQDLGIWLSSVSNPAGIVAWKESGGYAGTYSPNAAEVQAVVPVTHGVAYSVKLDWKTNVPALGASIYAGAGPISSAYSPTRLSVTLIPTSSAASAVSTSQFSLANSDGSSWQALGGISASLSPSANGVVVVAANADLWTANAGVNQDIGVFVSVNGGADQLVGWKESAGFAGTFSPNAAFLEATWFVSSGSSYAFKLKWKANKNAAGATIYAGAGPVSAQYSPTRLTVFYEPSAAMATAVSTQQYHLTGSDGAAWQPVDASGLHMTFTPGTTGTYLLAANADLWTANAGFNQDFGIYISGGAFSSAALVVWKESGGHAGTFSPNAAYAETVVSLQASTSYTIWIAWKANMADGGSIYAGAGPLPATSQFSPTRLTVIPT